MELGRLMGFRSDVRDSFTAALSAFGMTYDATLGDGSTTHIYSARPASLTDARIVFIGGIAETITHDSGVRRRTVEVTLVCTRSLGENTETVDDLEDVSDELIDYLTANPHLPGALTVQGPVRSTTTEVPDSGTYLPAVAIVASADIQEGRT